MKYTYNKEYLMRDEKPWFPVMGEFHYSRYRDDLWEESLRKMKAGGVTVVSTYAFWIHHEEEEGVYDFTGCRNIGEFLNICKKLDLPVFLADRSMVSWRSAKWWISGLAAGKADSASLR